MFAYALSLALKGRHYELIYDQSCVVLHTGCIRIITVTSSVPLS